MNWARRYVALVSAARPAARGNVYLCESLEGRVLLAFEEPVIVLTEAFALDQVSNVTIETVPPRLWNNPGEFPWNLELGNWNTTDGDMNGYEDDAYGWNFSDGPDGSPNIIRNGPLGGHGASAIGSALDVLEAADSHGDRVRIMVVIGSRAQVAEYVLAEKAQGVNIVAVAHSTPGGFFGREQATAFRDNGILLFVASSNAGLNADAAPVNPAAAAFYHATPRFGIQLPPVHTVIPATTDPGEAQTDYGINSFYFAAPVVDEQSFTPMVAAAHAAVAVEAYQEAHNGQNPTPEQVKRAMMSGVQYVEGLNDKTITHDYVSGARRHGGLLKLSEVIASINQTTPEIANVSTTQVGVVGTLGTTAQFQLIATGNVLNWTISWGDNSGATGSGVEVLDGSFTQAQHTFPFDNLPHHYFPTIYAMSGTKQVYLPAPSAQAEVVITTPFAPTSGQDHYTLLRSGANTVLTLQNSSGTISHTFAPGELPTCTLTLGQGQDILTVDFSNGNPLASTALDVTGLAGAGAQVRVIGRPIADSISVTNGTLVTVNGSEFRITPNLAVSVNAGAGDDQVSAVAAAVTLIGGAGNDSLNLPFAEIIPHVIDGGPDFDIDTLTGVSGPDASVSNVEYFVTTDVGTDDTLVNRHDFDGLLLFSLRQNPDGHTNFQVEEALFAMEVDAFGMLTYSYNDGELVPIDKVTSLLVNGENKDELFDIEADVDVTVNGGGGADWIEVVAPNATINGGAGNDTVYTGNTGSYLIDLGTGANTLHGGNGVDYVQLTSGATDTVLLGGGNDFVDALYDFIDDDYIDGGAGYDTLYIWAGLSRSNVNLDNIEEIVEV